MDELKKTLKEAATRLTETYANGLETVFYPDNGKPIPEGTILRTNIPNARFATPEEIARRNQKLAPGDEPMSTNERDTHFLGFARALLNEILDEWEGNLTLGSNLYPQDNERVAQHIAQRAYDLVYFLLDKAEYHSGSFDTGWGTPDEIRETISSLPDMDKWPE